MRLLFDQNLAARLVADLVDLFPGSVHVRDLGIGERCGRCGLEPRARAWAGDRLEGRGLPQRSFLAGPPPKVVWIRLGNCTTEQIAALLRREAQALRAFGEDPEVAFLALG